MNRQVKYLLVLTFLTSVFVGCSGSDEPDLYEVTGQVMFQGAPLAGAQITFVPEKGPVHWEQLTPRASLNFERAQARRG